MDRRDGPALDGLHQRAALLVIEDRRLAWSLAVEQPIGTAGIEPDHPIAHDLKGHAADLRRLGSAASIVDLRHGQQPPGLGFVDKA